jgi:aminoacyl tRNA synthase complex-interacting multifunctional protein 1
MASSDLLAKLEARATKADEMIALIRAEIATIRQAACSAKDITKLKAENARLKQQVDDLVQKLIQVENTNGVQQIPIPVHIQNKAPPVIKVTEPSDDIKQPTKPKAAGIEKGPAKSAAKPKAPKSSPEDKQESPAPEADVSRLDLRVGRIVGAKKHPDADSLYVEEVDVGEDKSRTVVSGLVKYVKLEELEKRLVVLLCNLKPAKMRGVTSQAMVMCASTPDKVELLVPPEGSVPGDRVGCEGFPGDPDAELNPKKKIWETVAPHLRTDADKFATYKGHHWTVIGKGKVTAPTLANVPIK